MKHDEKRQSQDHDREQQPDTSEVDDIDYDEIDREFYIEGGGDA